MKLNLTKDWLKKRAEMERDAETSAGFFDLSVLEGNQRQEHDTSASQVQGDNTLSVFGRLINLWRRKKGLRMDELADKARIDLAELIAIEHDIHYIPEPRTVHQLAKIIGLPSDRMLQLSGNTVVRDPTLGEEAIKFAARSESIEKLNGNEQQALEEFVKFLNEK
jgi:transcriptional regulator with XRE-family HTH domain